jgi:hypothetical protein
MLLTEEMLKLRQNVCRTRSRNSSRNGGPRLGFLVLQSGKRSVNWVTIVLTEAV